MAVTKPTKFPEWADGGSAVIVEPSDAKKLLGWLVEKPAYQFFNWLANTTYKWLVWIDQGYVNTLSVTAAGTTNIPLGSVDVFSDTTLGNQTLQLPDISTQVNGVYTANGMKVRTTKISADANTMTVLGYGGTQNISDAISQVAANQYTSFTLTAFNGKWYLS